MILRKPYALLIKNFRLIHFFMLLVSSYILYRTSIAYQFFNDYAITRQFIDSETLIGDTLPIIILFASLFMIISSLTIFILFRKKDKPNVVYLSSIIFYVVFLAIVVISRGMISTIVIDGLDPRIARIIRDFWLINLILEIVLVGFYLIRTLGFDVKKFNFGEDINELKIEAEDDEEFELTTGFNSDKLKMKTAMQKEELKSFYYENRFMIILILFILLVVIPGIFIARSVVNNKKYNENEIINLNNFEFSVVDSYITKKNSKGENIFKNEASFLIVKFKIKNLIDTPRGLKINNMRLELNGNVYSPNVTYYDSFLDIGKGYNGQEISKEEREYIVLYVVNDNEISGDIIFRYADKITVKNNEANALYYRVILNAEKIDINSNKLLLSLGETFTIPNGNAKFSVSHSNVKDKFEYKVSDKTKYIVNNYGLVLSVQYNYSSDNNMSVSDFLKNYAYVRYTINNKEYKESITNITPSNYTSSELYLAVNENIKDATNIELVFSSRNTEYVYKLK